MEQNQSPKDDLQQQTPANTDPMLSDPSGANGEPPRKKWGSQVMSASALVAIAAALVFYLIGNRESFSSFFDGIIKLLNPLLWGAFVAYMCNPILRFWERRVLKRVPSFHVKRMLGIILTYLCIIMMVALFGLILVPSLVSSINDLISNFKNYIASAVTYINNLAAKVMEMLPANPNGEEGELLQLDSILNAVEALISNADNIFAKVFNYLADYASQLISGVTDVILAVFISFYLLSSKELRLAQARKVVTAFCKPQTSKFIFSTVSMMHRTFGQYFQGVILDAMIVFVVGLIVFSIMNIPNALMIAFIIAITNVIPVFGPFLGAVPSAFIIFITDPEKTIPFVIAILVMQQIDGNIIAPRILGESTGISSLCVVISLAIMGGLWGIFGMVVGVPVFAVLVSLVQQSAEKRLTRKNLPVDVGNYYYDEPDEAEKKPHKTGAMHKLFTRALSACSYLGGYARYGVACLAYRLKGKKKPAIKPRKEDYLISRPEKPVQDDGTAPLSQPTPDVSDDAAAVIPSDAPATGVDHEHVG